MTHLTNYENVPTQVSTAPVNPYGQYGPFIVVTVALSDGKHAKTWYTRAAALEFADGLRRMAELLP